MCERMFVRVCACGNTVYCERQIIQKVEREIETEIERGEGGTKGSKE